VAATGCGYFYTFLPHGFFIVAVYKYRIQATNINSIFFIGPGFWDEN
jgi:hypothetical protein